MLLSLLAFFINRLVGKKIKFQNNFGKPQWDAEDQVNGLILYSRLSIEKKLIWDRKDELGNSIGGTRTGLNTRDSSGSSLNCSFQVQVSPTQPSTALDHGEILSAVQYKCVSWWWIAQTPSCSLQFHTISCPSLGHRLINLLLLVLAGQVPIGTLW